ncbi:glycosyl transferase family 1 [cyanobacterium TDX16]|nr:glycosyl transferase family 1 [cyanobacterium TDX16]
MLKIGLLNFCFEDYTTELANNLVKYVDLTLIQPEKVSAVCRKNLDPSIRVVSFSKPRIRDPRNLLSMRDMMQIVKEVQPDVLHVQETNDPWYDLTLFTNKMPPLVTTIHDVFRHPGDRQSVFGSEYTKRISFYKSQQLIVHTQLLKQALVEQFQISQERINVLPHGELGSLYLRHTKGKQIPREPYTLLFFGRIWPYKGLQYLLKAMPLIAEKIPEIQLIIAGRGENLRKYLPENYDRKRYKVIDTFIPPEQVLELFQKSTAVVLPYIESSQSGVALIAYALGTPVIASDVGGLRETIKSGENGLLVPSRDVHVLAEKIVELLKNKKLQNKLRLEGLSQCQESLNWSNIAAQTVEIYQNLLIG